MNGNKCSILIRVFSKIRNCAPLEKTHGMLRRKRRRLNMMSIRDKISRVCSGLAFSKPSYPLNVTRFSLHEKSESRRQQVLCRPEDIDDIVMPWSTYVVCIHSGERRGNLSNRKTHDTFPHKRERWHWKAVCTSLSENEKRKVNIFWKPSCTLTWLAEPTGEPQPFHRRGRVRLELKALRQ